jgi:hypothetical protein
MNFPAPIMISKINGVSRTERRFFVGAHDIAEYIASLGPIEREDRAGGVLHPHDPEAMVIPLGGGICAAIDADDYPLVKGYAWNLNPNGYAQAMDNDSRQGVLMHRLVLMVGPSSIVDHKDHTPLNNRKSNLRRCTQMQNSWNSRMPSTNTSGFKGVSISRNRWRGMVKADGVAHCEYFDTIEEANEWVKAKREELHGEFACHGEVSA